MGKAEKAYPGRTTHSTSHKTTMICTFAQICSFHSHIRVARITVRGTHQGEFVGVAPTGKQAIIGLADIVRIAGGKIAERWGEYDMLGLMQQLSAVPPIGQTGK